ncbi:hypothetical protein WU86_01120 [Corynebacterium xerosis]|nr:hypothetical protein WU86_01120 [Corynebacterium xerosis]
MATGTASSTPNAGDRCDWGIAASVGNGGRVPGVTANKPASATPTFAGAPTRMPAAAKAMLGR